MKIPSIKHVAFGLAALSVPLLTGASGKGCGGDVTVGNDDPCVVTGCSGQICADEEAASTCEWTDAYACYGEVGICERDASGVCGWRPTQELQDCLDDPTPPGDCVVTGCSGQICSDHDEASTCEWTDAYACYTDYGICERDASGACGWRETPELEACLADPRVPAEGQCVRNSDDACASDADCVAGGCGGELCFNPEVSSGVSDCDCEAPALGCGCVLGHCTWFE